MWNPEHKPSLARLSRAAFSPLVHAAHHARTGLVATVVATAAVREAHAALDRFDAPTDFEPRPAATESLWIRINVPAYRLDLVQGQEVVRSYPVAVGAPWTPTPRGTFRILQKTKDPTWAPRGRAPVPPGPANPLGHRWMRISANGYGIHATNAPGSIGHARSHGCIRMTRADAEELFELVPRDTRVEIVYETRGWDAEGQPLRYADIYGLERTRAAAIEPVAARVEAAAGAEAM